MTLTCDDFVNLSEAEDTFITLIPGKNYKFYSTGNVPYKPDTNNLNLN